MEIRVDPPTIDTHFQRGLIARTCRLNDRLGSDPHAYKSPPSLAHNFDPEESVGSSFTTTKRIKSFFRPDIKFLLTFAPRLRNFPLNVETESLMNRRLITTRKAFFDYRGWLKGYINRAASTLSPPIFFETTFFLGRHNRDYSLSPPRKRP